jgi:hypothetical protein
MLFITCFARTCAHSMQRQALQLTQILTFNETVYVQPTVSSGCNLPSELPMIGSGRGADRFAAHMPGVVAESAAGSRA